MNAQLVRMAFQRAEDKISAGEVGEREFWLTVESFIDTFASDRRFKLKALASTIPVSSAIVSYRGVKYYLDGIYNTETNSRTYSISRAN
jgi:hypothetical protein